MPPSSLRRYFNGFNITYRDSNTLALVQNFREVFRYYMIETAGMAVAVTTLSLGFAWPDIAFATFMEDRFYSDAGVILPVSYKAGEYANVTVAPLTYKYWDKYFLDVSYHCCGLRLRRSSLTPF